jgi:PAS domain S-box-containing protein
MERPKILIVEDESIIAKDLQTILGDAGYDVPYTAANSRDALRYTEELKPDLILMDVVIQGPVDGITTAQIINHVYDIPIIFLSAYSDKNTLDRARGVGSFGYLLKPCDERELLIAVDFGLQKARMDRMLKAQNRLLTSVIGNFDAGAIVINEKGIIQLINPQAQAVLGWQDSDLANRHISDLILRFNDVTAENTEDYRAPFISKSNGPLNMEFKVQQLFDQNKVKTGKLIYIALAQKNKQTKVG